MSRKAWFIAIVVVVVLVIFRHSSIPGASIPANADSHGASLEIPVSLTVPQNNDEFWGLVKHGDAGHYAVNVYANRKIVVQFQSSQPLPSKSGDQRYASSGQVRLNGDVYRAAEIDIHPGGTTGYIVLAPAKSLVMKTNRPTHMRAASRFACQEEVVE